MDDFFRVKGTLLRRSFRASFSVPPYMATCVAISMSVLSSVFINCKETYASVLRILLNPSIDFARRFLPAVCCVCLFSKRKERKTKKKRELTERRVVDLEWKIYTLYAEGSRNVDTHEEILVAIVIRRGSIIQLFTKVHLWKNLKLSSDRFAHICMRAHVSGFSIFKVKVYTYKWIIRADVCDIFEISPNNFDWP